MDPYCQVKSALRDAEGLPLSHQQLWMNGNEVQGMVGLSDLPEGFELTLNPIVVSEHWATARMELVSFSLFGRVRCRSCW